MGKWNQCQYCGRFIAYQEFVDGTATHNLVEIGVQDMACEWARDEYNDTWHNLCAGPVLDRGATNGG